MEGRCTCPDTFYCSDETRPYSAIKTSLLFLQSYAALVTSSLSCLGAALILCSYCAFKDLRKGTIQTIVALLALADLGSAVSCILGASLFIGYDHSVQRSEKQCCVFDTTCQIQGFMFTWSQFGDFMWTSILAIHLFLVTAFNQSTWINKLLPLYNVIGWMIPLAVALPWLFLDKLGFDPTFRWTCFLRWSTLSFEATIYFWRAIVLLTTALIFIGYSVILVYVSFKQTSRSRRNPTAWRVNKRILVILVAYIILRMPDAIQTISSTIVDQQACSDDHNQFVEFVISTMEAVTDTSQGWVNCILYIFLSPEMRRRMFVLPFRRAVNRCKRQKITQHLRTSEIDPQVGNTENTLSTQGRARASGETYVSYPTEFPDTPNNPLASRGELEDV